MNTLELDRIPQWFLGLEEEDAAFLKNFVLRSGSLKDIAKYYAVSYPTVRLRLDKLIQKIQINDQRQEAPFQAYIKSLAVDGRIDLESAKDILTTTSGKLRPLWYAPTLQTEEESSCFPMS